MYIIDHYVIIGNTHIKLHPINTIDRLFYSIWYMIFYIDMFCFIYETIQMKHYILSGANRNVWMKNEFKSIKPVNTDKNSKNHWFAFCCPYW